MKKLLAAFLALLGLAWWRKRAEAPPASDPAEELRAKLAEQREPEAAAAAEPEPEPEPEPQADVDTRRSEVHDRARQAMEDLAAPEE